MDSYSMRNRSHCCIWVSGCIDAFSCLVLWLEAYCKQWPWGYGSLFDASCASGEGVCPGRVRRQTQTVLGVIVCCVSVHMRNKKHSWKHHFVKQSITCQSIWLQCCHTNPYVKPSLLAAMKMLCLSAPLINPIICQMVPSSEKVQVTIMPLQSPYVYDNMVIMVIIAKLDYVL